MTREVIVATMWRDVEIVGTVDPAVPPTQADLAAIAASLVAENCGVRPVVRVLEDATLPRFAVVDPGPVCEDGRRSPTFWSPGRSRQAG